MQRRKRLIFGSSLQQSLIFKSAWILLIAVSGLLSSAYAATNKNELDNNSGVLHVHGVLTESACRLEMASAWQDINLGVISTAKLTHMGDQGKTSVVLLHLRDCMRKGSLRDDRTGNLVWAAYQPVVSVSFSAPADMNNPQLIRVSGISGLGLRLTDEQGRDVRVGSYGTPLLLAPGQDALTYHVVPERTNVPLQAGAYSALINFRLNYE